MTPELTRNPIKRRIDADEIALGAWANLADPMLVELLGAAGFDAVGIDLEHAMFGLDLVRQMIVAAEAVGIAPIVRIPAGDWDTGTRVLDAGARGIIVARTDGVETVRAAVEAFRFSPLGQRGAIAHSRAAGYGTIPWTQFRDTANDETLLVAMLEDTEAIQQIEEIAAVPGLDLITIGASDLAESIGVRDPGDPRMRSAIEDVAMKIRAVGGARLGFTLGHPALTLSVGELRDLGVVYANVSPPPEVLLMRALTETVKRTRAQWRQRG